LLRKDEACTVVQVCDATSVEVYIKVGSINQPALLND